MCWDRPVTSGAAVRLVRRAVDAPPPLRPDPGQQAVIAHRQGQGPLVVLGAPGTGKTTTLVEAVAARVERDGVPLDGVLVLAPTRLAAGRLRARLSARLAGTVREPLARTPHAYAFGLLRRVRVLDGEPPPRLISGPEQDRVLAELLAGHAAGEGRAPRWPASVGPQVLALRGLRDELRDLLMRAVERGLGPSDLADLGRRAGRPEWVAAADVLAEYLDVTAAGHARRVRPGRDRATRPASCWPTTRSCSPRSGTGWHWSRSTTRRSSAAASARLLDLLAGGGRDLILLGDPDAATQTFRGALPRLLAGAAERYPRAGGVPAATVVLPTAWRHGPRLREVAPGWPAGSAARAPWRTGRRHRRPRRPPSRSTCTCSPRRRSRPRSWPRSFAASTCSAGWRGRRWRSWSAPPAAPSRCAGRWPPVASRFGCRPRSCPCGTSPACGRCGSRSAACCGRRAAPHRSRPSCWQVRSAAATRSACAGCAGRCGRRRSRTPSSTSLRSSDELLVEALRGADPHGDAAVHGWPRRPAGWPPCWRPAGPPRPSPGPARSRCSGRSGRPPGWPSRGSGPPSAAARPPRARTATWTRWWRCSRPRPGSSTGCPAPAPAAFLDYLEGQELPADTLAERAPSRTRSPCSPRTRRRAGSGTWSRSPASRRAAGRTCGCAARCSARRHLVDLLDGRADAQRTGRRRAAPAVLDDELRLFLRRGHPGPAAAAGHRGQRAGRQPSPFLDLSEVALPRPMTMTRTAPTGRRRAPSRAR